MWYVSRQQQWQDGKLCVEINSGGADYANPDQLVSKYKGEAEEYTDPREAVNVGIEIAKAWRAELRAAGNKTLVRIDHGGTGGMTMPFDGMPLTNKTFKELREWAAKAYEKLPKCCKCGNLLPESGVYTAGDWSMDDEKFCREYCAEEWIAEQQRFNLECTVEDMTDEKVREVLAEDGYEFDETDTPDSLRKLLLDNVLSGSIEEGELVS